MVFSCVTLFVFPSFVVILCKSHVFVFMDAAGDEPVIVKISMNL